MAVMTNFRGIDMLGATPNDQAKKTKTKPKVEKVKESDQVEATGPENTPAVAETPDDEDDEVPSANAMSVLEWSDNDKERAGRALAKEKTRENPRKILSSELEEIINK